jgi:hypothetical protein
MTTRRIFSILWMGCLACGLLARATYGQVTFERLVNSGKEPQNWLTYSGDYLGRRFKECAHAGGKVGVPDRGHRKA